VGGLKERAGVLLAGVEVGSVSTINLADDGKSVTILLSIYKNFKIYHDARFVIEQAGFLGDQYVSVIPTTNMLPLLTNGADVNCQEPFNLQEVARSASGFIERIDETAKKLDASVSDLQRVVLNEQTLTNFSSGGRQPAHVHRTGDGNDQGTSTPHRDERFAGRPRGEQRRFFRRNSTGWPAPADMLLATNGTEISVP
jgi:hypothetical protein